MPPYHNGYEVTTGIGQIGVVGLLRNGDGPTVMLRADMDALPIQEGSGLDYASTVSAPDPPGAMVPVAHAYGHDIKVAWLMGVSALFARVHDAWRGTLIILFQPGEKTVQCAWAMIDDGLFTRFPKPDVVLGQHVMVGPVGIVAGSAGPISASDELFVAYEITRSLAIAARAKGLDGIIYPSYFSILRTGGIPFETMLGISLRHISEARDHESAKVIGKLALFGRPIAEKKVSVVGISRE